MVNIPIGLPEKGPSERMCDVEARCLLAPARGSSVFPVPCRRAVHAVDYPSVLTANRSALARGISNGRPLGHRERGHVALTWGRVRRECEYNRGSRHGKTARRELCGRRPVTGALGARDFT